ncbi:MAG: ABC transporter ATP-binding protein [Lachnospiraceae bacterium]|nr:ABC transporter ATP-binding protein [Lachnospiraceae bacterium]
MSEDNKAFLSIKDLVVEYTQNKQIIHAVNGVSLELERGRTLGLVGETGAGKTTIAKSILRILLEPPAKIVSGEIELDGRDLLKLSEKEMSKIRGEKVSMIFQDPMTALNPTMRVGEQIADAIWLHKDVSKHEAREMACQMLERVGIPRFRAKEYPHQFSGGMKQRVVIAIALACNPELLLADEPTTALDVTIQAQVLALINDLKKEHDTAMILITHDLSVVAETCDEVAVIYAGEIVEQGTLDEVFDNASHPYTKGLFGSMPKVDKKEERLQPIAGMMPDPSELLSGCKFQSRCPFATDKCIESPIGLSHISGTHWCRCIMTQKEKEA